MKRDVIGSKQIKSGTKCTVWKREQTFIKVRKFEYRADKSIHWNDNTGRLLPFKSVRPARYFAIKVTDHLYARGFTAGTQS